MAQDRKTGMTMATALNQKGVVDLTGQKLLTRFLELLGYKEIVLKSDGEHSLVRMKKAAGRDAKNLVKTICEESPAGDSRANGEAEAAVREIKWRIKAIHLMLEKKFDGGLPEGHPLTLWIPRYVAEQSNRYKVGADGVLGMTSEGVLRPRRLQQRLRLEDRVQVRRHRRRRGHGQ